MGKTVIEKIVEHNTGKSVKPGDIAIVNVDRVMIHDIFIPFVAEKFEEMGFKKLWDPDKVVLIYDHLVPASQQDDTRHFRIGNAFAEKYGMTHVHRSDGICHQLMTEAGYVKPGDIAFGTDSHTTTYGCVGAFSSGIGYTEMASILGTDEYLVDLCAFKLADIADLVHLGRTRHDRNEIFRVVFHHAAVSCVRIAEKTLLVVV